MPRPKKIKAPPGSTMKALIIYDNFAFAAKANAMLQRAASQADAAISWNIRPWRVDVLNLHRSAEEALVDATDAHLIVFAGQRAKSLPSWLEHWLGRWVASRQVKDAAFAVIGGRNGEAFLSPASPELSLFARKHGLDFITDDGFALNRREPAPEADEPMDKAPLALVSTRFPDGSVGNPYRGWGIND